MTDIVTLVRTRVVEILTKVDMELSTSDLVLARIDALPYIDDESYLTSFQDAMADVSREMQSRIEALEASTAKQQADLDCLMAFYSAVTSDSIH